MVNESRPQPTPEGLLPQSGGWYVVNAREARWVGMDGLWRSAWIAPEDEETEWPGLVFRLTVLDPGNPMAMYHGERDQEDFLIVAGEATLVIEGQERHLSAWDFVHCPPWTEHVLVGAGEGSCVVVAVSTRSQERDTRYVAHDLAARHGAAPPETTTDPGVAYAQASEPRLLRYREGDLR